MKKLVMLLVFMLVCQVIAAETISPDKKVLIDKLMYQTGQSAVQVGKQLSDVYIQQMVIIMKKSNKDVDPQTFSIIEEEIKSLINEEIFVNKKLAEMMYPIYAKHFTSDELKQMIDLYDTPLGKKMIKVMPLIAQESMQAGQTFGQTLAPKIQSRLEARFKKEGIK